MHSQWFAVDSVDQRYPLLLGTIATVKCVIPGARCRRPPLNELANRADKKHSQTLKSGTQSPKGSRGADMAIDTYQLSLAPPEGSAPVLVGPEVSAKPGLALRIMGELGSQDREVGRIECKGVLHTAERQVLERSVELIAALTAGHKA